MSIWPAGFFLSVLSGLLLTAGFPKPGLFFLSWVALVPLFLALHGRTWREAAVLGTICGIVHFGTALYWIRFVVGHYGGLPLPVAVLILLLLCAYLALYIALFAVAAQRWAPVGALWIFGLPSVWVTLEWVRAHALTGFPWASLGYTQAPFTPLIQVADVTGVYGLSWLIVLGNTVVMACIRRTRVPLSLFAFGGLFLLALSYGMWRIQAVDRMQQAAEPWTVGVVQGNIDQSLKWDPVFQQETLQRYGDLSRAAAGHNPLPDLIIWPETAVPFFYGLDEKLTPQLDAILRELGRPVLFGSPGVSLADGKPRLQNRAYLVNGGGALLGSYAKRHLVPFGEYVPLQSVLFFVHRLVEAAGDFIPGRDPSPLVLGGQPFGVLICYEGIFPELSRHTVKLGATALVNITNDAWFGDSSAPYQHLDMARWRAVEFRVPVIRAANTGVSAVFDATGRLQERLPLDERGYFVRSVRPVRLQTFYGVWGDCFAWICIVATLTGLAHRVRRPQAV